MNQRINESPGKTLRCLTPEFEKKFFNYKQSIKLNMNSFKSLLYFTLLSGVLLVSCGEDDPKPALQATLVENLPADPATGFNPTTGQPTGTTGKYKFFSFKTGDFVANTDSADIDPALWDIGFRGTTIIVNSGTSGPGSAAAQIVGGIFDELLTAPDAGYVQDGTTKAIPTGSGGWFTASAPPTIITPIAGKIIVIKTVDGKYAKMEILSYYKDAPASPNPTTDLARYYTFRYVYQPDGSKSFE